MESSPVYSFYGNEGEHYYGCSYLTIGYHNRKEIVIIQQVLNEKDYMVTQLFFFALICVASIIAVYFISRIIVSKSLHPLKEGLRRQNEFIAAASHELRSPLTVIMAGISTLKLKNAVKEEIIPCIDREGERMAKLIHDMLLIASSDAKTWTLNLEEIEMDTFFIHLYDSLTQFCRKKRQKLTLELPEKELPLFVGDRMRLEQILVILFDNACSYSPENSIITIQVSEHKKCLRIEVMDHGCGIPTEDKNRIFDRFYRSDRSRNDKNHFGLGLSIAAELVTMHRGKITVRDTNGGGTTFVVELPVVKQ